MLILHGNSQLVKILKVTFKVPADIGVGFEALKLLVGAEVGVGVVQTHHKTHHHFVAFGVVQKRAAVHIVLQRPAGAVHGKTGLVALRVNLPQLFDANAIALGVFAGVKLEAGDDLFAQVTARTFGKHRVLGMQFHAELEVFSGLAIFAHPHVAGGHAFDSPRFGVEHFGRGKAREYFNAQGLGLLRQPAGHVTQADDVIAVVLKTLGQQPVGRVTFLQTIRFLAGGPFHPRR